MSAGSPAAIPTARRGSPRRRAFAIASPFRRDEPGHGECGGYMALGGSLIDASGVSHPMAGLLGVETSFEKRRMTLGYREARFASIARLGPQAWFAWTRVSLRDDRIAGGDDPFASVRDAYGAPESPAGSRRGRVTGSFFHVIAEVP